VIAGAGASNAGPDAKLGEVLKEAADTLRTAKPSDPITLAAAEEEVGRAMMSLGMLDAAQPLLADADKLYAGSPPSSDVRMDSALNLGELAFYQEKHAEAEKIFRDLLTMERASGAKMPSQRESTLLNDLGASVRAGGRADEAITLQREALAATITVYGAESLEAAETRNNLASAMFQKGDAAGAVEEYAAALKARTARLRPSHPLVVRCQSNLGLALLRSGRAEDAVPVLEQAATGWDAAFGSEHPGRVLAMTSLSQALRKLGRQPEALDWLGRALQWQQAHGAPATSIAATEANMGLALSEQGKTDEAAAVLERAVPVLRTDGKSPAIIRASMEALASIYDRTGRADKASELRQGLK
jgi:tetratricopeptide (TPR) repeat protein